MKSCENQFVFSHWLYQQNLIAGPIVEAACSVHPVFPVRDFSYAAEPAPSQLLQHLLLTWNYLLYCCTAASLLSVMNDKIIFGISAIQAKRAGPCRCCENKSIIINIAIPFPSGLDIALLQGHLVRGRGGGGGGE